jgi:photosystem II stability/assembly factor-like uncharacterized protein
VAERAAPPAVPPAAQAAPQDAAPANSAARASGAAGAFNRSPLSLVRAAPQLEVLSPDPKNRWRVSGTGLVERSTDGGAQWQPASLPESATLTGGSSPAASVCWLVGQAGAIYLTTDGLRFIRVPFPSRTDFVSIRATDAMRATVVTSDGRTLRTEDRGATWTPLSR